MFKQIQHHLNLPSTYPSGVKILELLISMGLAARVPLEDIHRLTPSKEIFSLGIQESQNLDVDPLELLQTYNQAGIICYFSALAYLNLTTQIASHHHIAIPIRRPKTSKPDRANHTLKADVVHNIPERSRLGTPIFSYQGTPFYSTKRIQNTVPGFKIRILSPKTQIQITTIEQSLLDTLHFPVHCGGPETVFEAWEKGVKTLDDELILEYLKKIDIVPLTRRTGAIFELLEFQPRKDLDNYLRQSRTRFLKKDEFQLIHLLKGIAYNRINSYWNVAIP